jgi:hypothetical protein
MRYFAVVTVVLVSGCAMDWSRPGSSPEQVRQDYAECDISATGKHPPNVIKAGSLRPGEPSIDTRFT